MGSQGTNVACGAFKPITWSHKDTKPTVRQIIGHNAVGKKICGWRGH